MRDIIEEAVAVLRRGGLIVYPTETVYGLGADAFCDDCIMKVFEAKKRNFSQPLSVAVSDEEMLMAITYADEEAEDFIREFLPGPVTVILPASSSASHLLTGGAGLIGIRMPDNETALEIISLFDAPITSTSANLSGSPPPCSRAEVTVGYDLFVDGGILSGTPSTVVNLVTKQILRAGDLTDEIIRFFHA